MTLIIQKNKQEKEKANEETKQQTNILKFLSQYVFNEQLTTYFGSYLTFKEINNFSCVSKKTYRFF